MRPDLIRSAEDLGAALRRRRRMLNLTQQELALRASTTQKTVSLAEAGAPGTKVQTLFDLLAALEFELIARPRGGNAATIEEIF